MVADVRRRRRTWGPAAPLPVFLEASASERLLPLLVAVALRVSELSAVAALCVQKLLTVRGAVCISQVVAAVGKLVLARSEAELTVELSLGCWWGRRRRSGAVADRVSALMAAEALDVEQLVALHFPCRTAHCVPSVDGVWLSRVLAERAVRECQFTNRWLVACVSSLTDV